MDSKFEVLLEKEYLELAEDGNDGRKYPYIWLRNNCMCDKCFHVPSQKRRNRLEDLMLDPKVSSLVQENGNICLTWDDGHVSNYPISWLIDHTFPTKETRKLRYRHVPKLWSTEMQENIPTFNFDKLMREDESLLDWIVTMDTVGLCVIKSAPPQEGQIEKLSSRVAFLRRTQYGTIFKIVLKLEANNVAFTNEALDLHTDNAYRSQPPGVQFLHCIVQAGDGCGGESTACDGFYAASQLKKQQPEYYRLLCKTKLDVFDAGSSFMGKFHYMYHGPVFTLDCNEELQRINFADMGSDSYMGDVTLENVKDVYMALKMFDELLRKHSICYKLKPGEILVLDNRRVLHGRKAFTLTPGNERLLEGGYIDWDHMYSKMRVLASNQQ